MSFLDLVQEHIMNITSLLQIWLFWLLIVHALVVPSVQNKERNLSELSLLPSQTSWIDHLNQTSLSLERLANKPAVYCDGDQYGRDLILADCRDAITGIPRSRQLLRFGDRSADPETWDVGLPSRQIGIQGLCTVQLEFKPGRSSAIATSLDISQAALAVLGVCVGGTGTNTGGLAIDIGGDNNLGVALVPYEPHVQCVDGSIGPPGSTVPPLKSCDAVAGMMFAAKDVTSFGKSGSGATNIVPGMDTSPDRLCTLGVDTTGPIEKVSWYDIWAAVVAVNGMCVRNGKTGKATGLGENGNLFIAMWKPPSSSGQALLPGNTTLLRDENPSEAVDSLWLTS